MIDIDATLVDAHTEKEGAAVNYRSGFGFHPMLAYLDETHEALAGVLRGGGAPAHSAQAQIDVLDLALAQLPVEVVGDLDTEIVMRIDSAGAASALCQAAQDASIAFLVGFDLFTGVRESILQLPENAWRPAIRQDGQERDGAQIAEITHVERLDLTPWPDGSRVIIRRERPHPGAQLKFTDANGHRFQATLTDLTGDAVEIERLHRGRGDAENLIRGAKQTGLENLPFHEFALNAVWLELSLIAQNLIAWTQQLCLEGELAICEPKALRYRLLHTAGRLSFHARRAVLRLPANWPWRRARRRVHANTRAAITRRLIPSDRQHRHQVDCCGASAPGDPLSRKSVADLAFGTGPGSTAGHRAVDDRRRHRLATSGAINCHLPAATAQSGRPDLAVAGW